MTDRPPLRRDRHAPTHASRTSALVGSAAGLKSAILAANVVMALVLATVVGLQAASDRRATVESAYLHVENLTEVLAEHTRQTLQGLDLGLRTVVEAARLSDPSSTHDQTLLHEVLANRQRGSTATFAFFVLDAHGRLLATSRVPSPQRVDLSDYPEFTVHRDGQPGVELFLGFPRKGRVGYAEDKWIVNLTRRIDRGDGSFGGVVAASLSLDYLLDFYRALSIGEEGALGLMSRDGVLIVRAPFDAAFVGRDMSGTDWFERQIRRTEKGRFAGSYATDGIQRLSAHEWVAQRQAVVYVGLGADEMLAPWRKRLLFQSAIGLLAMALLAVASWIVWRHFLQTRQWEEQRSQRLRAGARASAELVSSPDVEGALQRAAELARELLGVDGAVARLHRTGGAGGELHALSFSQGCLPMHGSQPPGDRRWLLTQAQIEQDAAWQWLQERDGPQGDARQWLAVPMRSQDGHALGSLRLCGKQSGQFTEDDLSEATQLASVAAAVLENLVSLREREAALAEANRAKAELETVFTSISDAVYALDSDWRFVYLNDQAQRLLGRKKAELLGKNVWDEFPGAKDTALYPNYRRARDELVPVSFEFFFPPLASWFSVRAFPQEQGGLTVYFHDITTRVETEERLRQSQKMDAIGQLTGGVAHDFNNLLTVILGAADEIVEHAGAQDGAVGAHAEIIRKAGERAAALTHRLLAFARKQPLEPRLTNVNELLADFEDLLRRTLGEQVEVELVRGAGLWKALIDPHELQNAILNLAINARDAMPNGGHLTIETANVSVDHAYGLAHQMAPGQYVLVAVSDTGEGMSGETLAKAFDPFFTTKPLGKGSGLGLSMVYGFVRQSGGHAKIYSEPQHGTTVKLYLPREHQEADEAEYRRPEPGAVVGGSERVLVVEDDEFVRMLAVASLERLGYAATARDSGRAALELLDNGAQFDLLLTDMVLTGGMSGKQVAGEARQRSPGLKVLYMSGYTENAIVHHGRLDRGVHLLGKPFRLADLARKVREVLDQG
ncbi:ATP-binding protein [Schlegelella sp. S2-27]|uniref:histidine kinase n=1 Tax=Caldimonas mangrovi TaxID=2944811 RepID=A0ABT0YMC7_9BURK|nr:ATP-binding protein [Caldimonas mangrovi]MCM5679886.1 ATP-binding protein [Caldimonas mangrovi]